MKNYISNQNLKFYIKKQNDGFYLKNVSSMSAFQYQATGSIELTSSFEFSLNFTWEIEFSWNIEGFLEKEITFEWQVGDGEFYWYRIEGECSQMNCETSGLDYDCDKNMTIVTAVAARNLAEVCDILKSPRLNPPLNLKLLSIKKYSRPVLKTNETIDDCNVLEVQEFCQIPECLDYCIDENIVFNLNFDSYVKDAIYEYQASGGFLVSGSVELANDRFYWPSSPIVSIYGFSPSRPKFTYESSAGLFLSGSAEYILSFYNFNFEGGFSLLGQSRAEYPKRRVYDSQGSILLSGNPRISRDFYSNLGVVISGSSDFNIRRFFNSYGGLDLGGTLSDFGSPFYSFVPKGNLLFNGSFDFKFRNIGTIDSDFYLSTSVFDFNVDFNEINYQTNLSISDFTISPNCGCGPIGLFLTLRHNLNNSNYISKFSNRNSTTLPENIFLRYKNTGSWSNVQHFLGRGIDGNSIEELTLFFSLSCEETYWKFSFIAKSFNKTTDIEKYTKFLTNIASDFICNDNNISTSLKLRINSGELITSRGRQIQVVSPNRISSNFYNQVNFLVDDIENDYSIYYDNIGLFKDSYWENVPFEINIEPNLNPEMQSIDLNRIFK